MRKLWAWLRRRFGRKPKMFVEPVCRFRVVVTCESGAVARQIYEQIPVTTGASVTFWDGKDCRGNK